MFYDNTENQAGHLCNKHVYVTYKKSFNQYIRDVGTVSKCIKRL